MSQNIKNLKKKIIYRCYYTGTKETDLLYKQVILKRIHRFNNTELQNLLNLFETFSDSEIFLILTGKKSPHKKYESLFNKLLND